MKNLCAKTRPVSDPYEVWQCDDWTWKVLKKYQADDKKDFARWFVHVTSPLCPQGEMGDEYAANIMGRAVCVRRHILPHVITNYKLVKQPC